MKRTKESWYKLGVLERIIFIAGISISILFAFTFHSSQKRKSSDKVNGLIEKSIFSFERKINIYETILIQTQTYLLTLEQINEQLFSNYYTKLSNLFYFEDFKGIGFSRYVTQENLPHFLKETHNNDPSFKIWPASNKKILSPVMFLEPKRIYDRSLIGFDQASEEKRFKACTEARKTGQTTMTGKIQTPQSRHFLNNSFLLIRSIYTESNYQNVNHNIDGFVFSQFTYREFFKDAWFHFKDDIDYQVYETNQDGKQELVYTSMLKERTGINQQQRRIEKFGKTFLIIFFPKENLAVLYSETLLILFLGLVSTFLIFRNVNQAKKMAQETDLYQEKLEETLKGRDEFISITSHELKTPLTTLKLRAQFLKRKMQQDQISTSDTKHFISDIEQQTLRLEILVNDILDLSRIRTGQFSYSISNFNLFEIISETFLRMKEQFKNIPGERPEIISARKEIMVSWDKFRIEQVLTNLLTNAVKYGDNSPITIGISNENESVIISVSDKGRGIHQEAQEMIFNRFERAGISANEISGLGLGLYITYQIVTYHKGKIWVESELGKGSTFYIKIPQYPTF